MKIQGIELTPEHVGRSVLYVPQEAREAKDHSHPSVENGRIKTWNEKTVFCWYGIGDTAAGTNPEDLRWGT